MEPLDEKLNGAPVMEIDEPVSVLNRKLLYHILHDIKSGHNRLSAFL